MSRTEARVYLTPEPALWVDTGWYYRRHWQCPAPKFLFSSSKANSALVSCFRLSSDLENHSLPHLRVKGESGLGFGSFKEAHSVHKRKRPMEDTLPHTWAVGGGQAPPRGPVGESQ